MDSNAIDFTLYEVIELRLAEKFFNFPVDCSLNSLISPRKVSEKSRLGLTLILRLQGPKSQTRSNLETQIDEHAHNIVERAPCVVERARYILERALCVDERACLRIA